MFNNNIINCVTFSAKTTTPQPEATPREISQIIYNECNAALQAQFDLDDDCAPNNYNPVVLTGNIPCVDGVEYSYKFEILRDDLGDSDEHATITFNGKLMGICNPPGNDDDCDFYDCGSDLTGETVTCKGGSIDVVATYSPEVDAYCDCDLDSWQCVAKEVSGPKKRTFPGHNYMHSAARITLYP